MTKYLLSMLLSLITLVLFYPTIALSQQTCRYCAQYQCDSRQYYRFGQQNWIEVKSKRASNSRNICNNQQSKLTAEIKRTPAPKVTSVAGKEAEVKRVIKCSRSSSITKKCN